MNHYHYFKRLSGFLVILVWAFFMLPMAVPVVLASPNRSKHLIPKPQPKSTILSIIPELQPFLNQPHHLHLPLSHRCLQRY